MREGLRYIVGWPGLVIMGFMAMAINFLLNPAIALLPILVTGHFRGGVVQLATVESAFGIGVVIGGLLLGVWGGFKRRMHTALMGLVTMGLGFLTIGLLPPGAFWVAVGLMFVAALMNAMTNGPIFAILQAAVAPEMQGRVFSLMGATSALMAPIGLAVGGPVADALGVQSWYLLGGGACVLMAATCLFIPSVMNLEDRSTAGAGRAGPVAAPAIAIE
jgi:DHA3 family macrolide efflux protein-like MFS transporter